MQIYMTNHRNIQRFAFCSVLKLATWNVNRILKPMENLGLEALG